MASKNPRHRQYQNSGTAGTKHPARTALNPWHSWHQTSTASIKPVACPAPNQHSLHQSGSHWPHHARVASWSGQDGEWLQEDLGDYLRAEMQW